MCGQYGGGGFVLIYVNIEKYIHKCYDGKGIRGKNPKTTFIAYGADLTLSNINGFFGRQ